MISKCLICRRHEGPSFCLHSKERVSRCDPFQFIGLDYLGPLYIYIYILRTELKKAWVCLFTCLRVRAIHLEWVLDLTAIQFLSCLRRFVSCRGKPDMIISDNAPQFRLTKTTLDEQCRHVFKDEDVLNYVSMEGIKWSFSTVARQFL